MSTKKNPHRATARASDNLVSPKHTPQTRQRQGLSAPAGRAKPERAPFPKPTELRRAALDYADHGWPVLPMFGLDVSGKCLCWDRGKCKHPGKHPRTRGKRVIPATVEPGKLSKAFDGSLCSNIGISCGGAGVVVLDIDPRNGGADSLARLIHEHSELPATPEVSTGGDGRHFYFKAPAEAIRKGELAHYPSSTCFPLLVSASAQRRHHVLGKQFELGHIITLNDDVTDAGLLATLLEPAGDFIRGTH